MVLTTSHTISKSKTDEETFDDTIDNIREFEYSTEYTVNKHDRFHHKPRRQEKGRTITQKTKQEKAVEITKTRTTAMNNKHAFFPTDKFLNLFKKKKFKTPKKFTKKREAKKRKTTDRNVMPNENTNYTTTSRRSRRKHTRNLAVHVQKRETKSSLSYFTKKGKLPPQSSGEFYYNSGFNYRYDHPASEVMLPYEISFITETPSTTVIPEEPSEESIGTAQLENILDQIKERALLMIANQPPSISEMITTTVTETTFEADPILGQYFPTKTLKDLLLRYVKQKRSMNSTIPAMESRIDARSLKNDIITTACCLEAQLQKEIKELLNIVKAKLCCGAKQVKYTTEKAVYKAKEAIHKATSPKRCLKCSKTMCTCKTLTPNTPIIRNVRSSTTNKLGLFHYHKTTPNMTDQPTSSVDDDYSMLKLFEQVLSKTHEDNVRTVVPIDIISYKRNMNKVSKRNQETIEDLNLKENMRKLSDSDPIPDEIDYNNGMRGGESKNEEINTEAMRIDLSTVDRTSLEGLSERISYKEYVDGFKNYLNYVRDTTKANFSNLVRYQAHRHHKVEDIGKFILKKIPNAVPLARNKRRFFDDSDGDDQDMSTKSDESWFKRHFYLFIDTAPPKKYHTAQTVSLKHMSEKTVKKRGKETPTTVRYESTADEVETLLEDDIEGMINPLDYTKPSPAAPKVNGRLYLFFFVCNTIRSHR